MTLGEIVDDYRQRHARGAERELRFYAMQRTLADAIREAALSRLPGGKRHPHQRRIAGAVLRDAERVLQSGSAHLQRMTTFDALFRAVDELIRPIPGIGELAVYDIAHRIGAFLKLEPERVYFHAGTRRGAAALGLRGKSIAVGEVPAPLRGLTPAEIEDCLCIYKDAFRSLRQRRQSASWRR